MSSAKFRCIWFGISRMKKAYESTPNYKFSRRLITAKFGLSFSIFTWLGFEKKISAENELINTIKDCLLFIERTEYEHAEELLGVALRIAEKIGHKLGITYIYDVMANLALEREELDKAKKLFNTVSQRIIADGATDDDTRVVHIRAKMARIYHLQKDYLVAQRGYEWCLEKLYNQVNSNNQDELRKLMAMTEDWYGRLFLDRKQYDNALKYMTSALNYMIQVPDVDPAHIVKQIYDIGKICTTLGKVDESIKHFTEAIQLGEKFEMDDMGAMYVSRGQAYLKKKMIELAKENCGYGLELGVSLKREDLKKEAESCLKQINEFTR